MNFLKRFFNRKKKVKKEEKKDECWYNDAHENGEAVKNSTPIQFGGSENFYEAALTKSNVRK